MGLTIDHEVDGIFAEKVKDPLVKSGTAEGQKSKNFKKKKKKKKYSWPMLYNSPFKTNGIIILSNRGGWISS